MYKFMYNHKYIIPHFNFYVFIYLFIFENELSY